MRDNGLCNILVIFDMHLARNERLSSRTAVASICPDCLYWLLAHSLANPRKGTYCYKWLRTWTSQLPLSRHYTSPPRCCPLHGIGKVCCIWLRHILSLSLLGIQAVGRQRSFLSFWNKQDGVQMERP